MSKYHLNVTEAISEDSVFQWSKLFYHPSTVGHPSNQTSMSSSPTWSSVSTAAQLGRSIKIGGSQSNLRNQRKAALKTPWRSQWMAKNHLGKAQSQMWGKKWGVDDSPLWLHRAPSLPKWLSWLSEKVMKSVPFPSSAPAGHHPLRRPPRSSESFPCSTLSSSDCQKNSFHFIPQQIKNANLYSDQTA